MIGKTCMVTGATSGIGAVTAEALARQGATVVVVGRSREKCQETVGRIQRETGNRNVSFLLADLSSQADIRRLAHEFQELHPYLHVLVNNAGGIFLRRQFSADGIEMTFALNHLGYFLLTNLLLDRLLSSAPARIVNVSSIGHHLAKGIAFDDLQLRRRIYRPFPAYFQSKLANLLFTYELARRLEGTGVTVNALHPGIVATNFGSNNGWLWHLLKPVSDWLLRLKYISPEEGARAVIYLASAPERERVTGQYFVEQQPVDSSAASRDEAAARRLWQISAELTGLMLPQAV